MKNNNVAILISSYDGFSELWHPLEESYNKYWPDNPYTVYIATNHLSPDLKTFKVLKIGNEKSWSDNIIKCLDRIEEDYVILSHVDLFLCKKIDTDLVRHFVNETIKNNWDYLRLHPSPKPEEIVSDKIGRILPDSRYRASTVFPIFKKSTFLDLLDENESAWQFEINASIRSNKYPNFYSSRVPVTPYLNAIVKGKWVRSAYYTLKKEGMISDPGRYPIMSRVEELKEMLLRLRLKIFFLLIPAGYRNKVSRIAKKMF